jgi:hypothetical protein
VIPRRARLVGGLRTSAVRYGAMRNSAATRRLSALFAAVAAVTAASCKSSHTHSHSHSSSGAEAHAAAAPALDMEKMMAEMQRLGTPGPEHEALMKDAGVWDNATKFRMAPDQLWMQSSGSVQARALLGGRYLWQDIEGSFMNMPFHSFQLLGFDKMSNEYTALWADSMSTWTISSRGKKRPDGAIELRGTMVDVAGERPFRMVVSEKGPDERLIFMYDTIPPHGEIAVMEITSTRRK